MDRLIKENLEAILQDIAGSKRLGRRLINLAGFLGTTEPPPHIQEQFNRLSRLVVLQDAFDALLEPITLLSRAGLSRMLDVQALQAMTASLEAARQNIAELGDVNYPELISWLVAEAQARKIVRMKSPEKAS
jgi:hypothetical protein